MSHVDQLCGKLHNEFLDKGHPILVLLRRHFIGTVVVTGINKIFWRQLVAKTLFKIFQRSWAHGFAVACPIAVNVLVLFTRIDNKQKRKGGESNYCGIWMRF